MIEEQLKKAFDDLWGKSAERNWIIGRLGVKDGAGGYDIDVPGRAGYVYVSLGVNGERGQATARDAVGVAAIGWTLVKMRREWGQLVIREADNLTGGGVGGGTAAPSPHALSGAHHSGLLNWGDLSKTGSSLADLATRNHSDLTGVTANQHHNQQHLITGGDHTITGSVFDLVGATGTNTLGIITPSSNPGGAAAILRTDSNGGVALDTSLFVVSAASDLVTIDTNLFYADAPNNRIGINRTPSGAALDVLSAANGDHTLRVKQKSGQTGRLWRVEDTAGDELIVLDSQGNLQSGKPGFVSGLTGWQVTPQGNAEFNNIWARGELHASVFVKDEVHVSGGTLLVANGAKLYADAEIDSTTVDLEELEIISTVLGMSGPLTITTTAGGFTGTTLFVEGIFNYIEVEDSPTGPGFYFDDGVVVRSKTEVDTGITDFWFTILGGVQRDGYQEYSVRKESGTDGTLPAGAALADYGVEGDGRILLTSDLNYAPYQDIFTVGPEPWSGDAGSIIPHVRLGRLDGVGVTAVSGIEQYGMIAGTDLSNANSPYIVASNLQLRLHKVDLTLNDGTNDTGEWTADGNLTIGANIATDAGKSFQVITTGVNAGDLIVGQLTGSYVHWDASAETLTVNGSLTLGGLVGNSITVGTDGHINSSGKDTFADTSAGFFLGWDTVSGSAYKFAVGDASKYLRWDGTNLQIAVNDAIFVAVPASKRILDFQEGGGSVRSITFTESTGIMQIGAPILTGAETQFTKHIVTGDTFQIQTSRNIVSSGATGITGEIAWNTSYLYVCIGTNSWRRISLGAAF